MGIASVLGLTKGSDWLMWLCVGVFCAWKFAGKTHDELFLHGFYLGIFDGIFNSLVQAVFVSTYLSNNPGMVEALNSLPEGLHPAFVLLIMGPIIGVVSGIVFGLLAVIAGKLVRRRISEPPSSSISRLL
jgi:hypothetical protein